MNIKIGKNLGLVFLIAAISASFFLGVYYEKLQAPKLPPELPAGVDFSLLWEVWGGLEEKYPKPLDYQKMIYGAASGLVDSLGDPYTVFFTPEESKIFEEDISGRFEGVGMEIGLRKDELTVIAPLEGTPAQKAGFRPGDKILKVNDASTKDMTVDKAVGLIRGPKGTEVALTILREGWDEPKEFKIARAIIDVPSVKWEIRDSPATGGPIAYIKLYQFSEDVDSDFTKAAFEILNSPAKKIILDLRNNPGGLLDKARDVAGWFLRKGDLVVIEDLGKEGEKIRYEARGNSMFLNYPVVILINQGTASGAEILAAALKDNREIILVGETTFGKGLVQEPVPLRGGSTLKVTVAQWLTPKGKLIDGIGLEPDVKIKMSDEDYEAGRDPQLDEAIGILKNL